jgi:WD40 repeat protein
MRQRFFPKSLIVSLFLILALTLRTQAQSPYIPITAQNAAQISQIERIGSGVPRAMTFSPDGSRLAVATTLGVWLIDLPVGARHASPELVEGQSGAESVSFSPDGAQIAAGGEDNSVMVFDVASGEIVARLENHIYPVSAVAWAGNYLASGDWSGVVRIWDTSNWSEYRTLPTNGKIDALTLTPSGELRVVNDDMLTIWNISSGQLVSQTETLAPTSYPLIAYHGTREAGYVAAIDQITIWDKGSPVTTLDGFYGELGSVFFTPDSRVGSTPLQSPYLWSLDGKLDDKPPPVLSPDGSRLATFGNDGVIHLKDAKSGSEIAALHGHIRAVTGVAFSPDGRLLVSSSNDGTIQVWDATVTQDSGSLVTLTGHNGGVSSVAFNEDGTLIASAGYDGTVRLWGIKA